MTTNINGQSSARTSLFVLGENPVTRYSATINSRAPDTTMLRSTSY
ncbi:hypothetical protein ACFYQT_31800 [Streptomyces tibetensis]|uniref:Uncharacterized protein n=1 Tax=Streptomyces tibetensis TaxID=2382123 RepID=A0ABW6N5V7_9ACTN